MPNNFFIRAAPDDLERIVGQMPLQRF